MKRFMNIGQSIHEVGKIGPQEHGLKRRVCKAVDEETAEMLVEILNSKEATQGG